LASLNACVNSITAELLIVDNGSTDNTASVLAQATRECTKFSLRILREERRGKANALNRGLRSAQGKIFLIVDDDVVVHPQCLIKHVESYRMTSFDAMQGCVLPGVDVDGKTADPKRLREYNIPIIDYGGEVREIRGLTGTNMSFKRAVFYKMGEFDTRPPPGAAGVSEDPAYSILNRTTRFKIHF